MTPAEQSKNQVDGLVDDIDDAVDDSGDADEDFASLQRTMSQKRRGDKENGKCSENRIQELLPFQFSPNIRPLSVSDVQSCIALENAAFTNKEFRASPEKIEYRLTTCPELSLGIFCTVVPDQAKDFDTETLATALPVETDRPDHAKSVLLAHIVATATNNEVITDNDMKYPADWRRGSLSFSSRGKQGDTGHQEGGRTVCIHSLAVVPKLQGCGLGKLIMKSYLQQMNNAGNSHRVALICQGYLVSYYERFGFQSAGPSKAEFGGGGWFDMVFDLAGPPARPTD